MTKRSFWKLIVAVAAIALVSFGLTTLWLHAGTSRAMAPAEAAMPSDSQSGAARSSLPAVPSAAEAAGYGIPPGTHLTPHEGDLYVTKAGSVISNLNVHGRILIEATDVTIENTLVHGTLDANGGLITASSTADHFTVENSEIRADTPTPYVSGIIGANFTARGLNIHNVVDQIDIVGGNVSISSSWLHGNLHFAHDPNHPDGSHDDNIQIQQGDGITISGVRAESAHNSAIMVTQGTGPVDRLSVHNDYLDNGACTVNVSEGRYGAVGALAIRDNEFGGHSSLPHCSLLLPVGMPAALSGNEHPAGDTVARQAGAR